MVLSAARSAAASVRRGRFPINIRPVRAAAAAAALTPSADAVAELKAEVRGRCSRVKHAQRYVSDYELDAMFRSASRLGYGSNMRRLREQVPLSAYAGVRT